MTTTRKPRPPSTRRALGRLGLVLVVAAAMGSQACALLLDWDYAGPTTTAPADASEAAALDAGEDVADATSEEASSRCGADISKSNKHCGACGRNCVEGDCNAGRCTSTVIYEGGTDRVDSIEVTTLVGGTFVYLANNTNAVTRVSLATGLVETAPTPQAVVRVSLDEGGTAGIAALSDGTLASFEHATFTTQPVRIITATRAPAAGIQYVRTRAFWGDVDGGVRWSDKNLDAAGGGGTGAGSVAGFSVRGARLYWTTAAGGIFSTPTATPGLVSEALAPSTSPTDQFFALDVTQVNCFLAQSQGLAPPDGRVVIRECATLDSGVSTVVPFSGLRAIDGTSTTLYVLDHRTEQATSTLYRTNADGTEPLVLADKLGDARGLSVGDADFVYYADGPRVLRTSR